MSKFTFNDASLETMSLSFDYGDKDYTVIVDVVGDVEIRRESNGLQYGDYLSINDDEFKLNMTFLDEYEDQVSKDDVLFGDDEKRLNDEIISKLFELKYKELTNDEY